MMKEKYYIVAALAVGGVVSTHAEAACFNMNTNTGSGTTKVSQGLMCFDTLKPHYATRGWTGGGSTEGGSTGGSRSGNSDWGYGIPSEPEKPDSCTRAGNPILVASGTKVEFENDFTGLEHFPLTIFRGYASSNDKQGAFGLGWSSSFDKRLDLTAKIAYGEDGQSVALHRKTLNIPHVGSKFAWVSASWTNYLYLDASGLWIFKTEKDHYEVYTQST